MTGAGRHVAFLRGINVGGHRVTSDELVAVFVDLGFTEVSTFLASGNVLFTADGQPDGETVAAALSDALGYGVPTTTRSGDEVRAIAERVPFTDDQLAASAGKPQVMLLFAEPKATIRDEVTGLAGDDDVLVFVDRELHWLPAAGISTTDLDLDRIAKLVGQHTMRAANTIQRLVPKLEVGS